MPDSVISGQINAGLYQEAMKGLRLSAHSRRQVIDPVFSIEEHVGFSHMRPKRPVG
jgi:hypothetical protein